MSQAYFEETQYFPKWITFLMFGILIWVTIVSFNAYGTEAFPVVIIVAFLPCLIIFLLIAYSRLETKIDDSGIFVMLFPFHWKKKHMPWSDIDRCEVIEYSPIKEYGGWGLRYGNKGKAYNVSGNKGIMIYFIKGKPLLIGTQKAEEVMIFLQKIGRLDEKA